MSRPSHSPSHRIRALRRTGSLLAACMALITVPAFAHGPARTAKRPDKTAAPTSPRSALIQALAGIDTVPSAAQLRRAVPNNTALQLHRVALDTRVDGWIRLRAVSVLPALGAVSSPHLLALANTAALPERMRWWAAFGWLRSPVPDAAAVAQSRLWLASPAWMVREAAVRGLRHRPGKLVSSLLRGALAIERHATVKAALRRVLRGR